MIVMKLLKSVLPILLIALFTICPIYPAQAQTAKIVVDPPTQKVLVCNEFSIDIIIRDIPDSMIGFAFAITWDANLMSLVGRQVHVVDIGTWQYYDDASTMGQYTIIAIDYDSINPIIDDTVVVTLTFHCEGEGSTPIDFSDSFCIKVVIGEEPFQTIIEICSSGGPALLEDFDSGRAIPSQALGGCISQSDELEYDFGDAPDSYHTLSTSTGAQHAIVGCLYLGTSIDGEADGQPNINALGDDTDADGDDEDGVVFPALPYIVGSTGYVRITVGERTNGLISETNPAYLHGWIDWNQDGDWDDYLENVFCGYEVKAAGTYTIFFPVPGNAVPGNTYARFRLDDENLNQITGLAQNGEVEDYLVDPAVSRFPPLTSSVVGGTLIPINELTILVPYFVLIGLFGAISSILAMRIKRKRQSN